MAYGFQVNQNDTIEQMLTKSDLNWKVQKRQLAMRPLLPDGSSDRSQTLTAPLNDFRAIVRSDTNEVFQVASVRYQPVQNYDIVGFFKEFCDAGHAEMERILALKDGAVIVSQCRLANLGEIGPGDRTEGKLFLSTSHDGSLVTMGAPTHISIVCQNTLAAARWGAEGGEHTFALRHTTKFDDVQRKRARMIIGIAIEQTQEINSLATQLARVTLNDSDWLDFMGKILGENLLNPKDAELSRTAESIKEATYTSPGSALPSRRGTLWGAVNGVTYYADHKARSRSESNRLFSAWFGQNRRLKADALNAAVEMAGIKR